MAKKSPTTLSPRKFFGKYFKDIQKNEAAAEQRPNAKVSLRELIASIQEGEYPSWPAPVHMWEEVAELWPFRVLRQAAEEGDSEGCKRLLNHFLIHLGIRLPKGVLVPFRWKRGRPNETEGVYEAWKAKGQPPMTWRVCDDIAKIFYAAEFAQAKSNPSLRKKLRDRVRGTILRHQITAAATESSSVS